MAILEMKRIDIVALLKDGKKIIELLQRRGVLEISKQEEKDGFTFIDTSPAIGQFEKQKQVADKALSIVMSLCNLKPPLSLYSRKELSVDEFKQRADKVDETLKWAYEIILLEKQVDTLQNEYNQLCVKKDLLSVWKGLDVPFLYKGTKTTKAFIGSLPEFYTEESLRYAINLGDENLDLFDIKIISQSKEQTCVFILCHNSLADTLYARLRNLGFSIPVHTFSEKPEDRIKDYEDQMQKILDEKNKAWEKLLSYGEIVDDLRFLSDYLSMKIEKYNALNNLAITKNTLMISGYITVDKVGPLVGELIKKFTVAIDVNNVSDEEDAPVALKNNLFAAPVEDITESYSLPGKGDVDPTPVMSFFYYLFFGMMLSDAGYGLLMVIACSIVLKFFRPEESLKRNIQKFLFCGLSTVFWGVMYGSWFGNIVNVVSKNFFEYEVGISPLWFDPVSKPLDLIIVSLILGFIHIVVGLGVKFYALWKNGDKLGALFDTGLWYVVFLGIILLLVGKLVLSIDALQSAGLIIALLGALGLVLTQGRSSPTIFGKILGGLGSLYSITGYFSDVLSYCRLMALGLVTGIIGNVINTIGSIAGGGVTGGITLALVFLFGHAINFSINALGAYVHCNRLQYVEFFSKFYDGGGRPFKPLKINTKFYKFKEEK